jgi:cytochrome c oxidase subunit 2
MLATVVLWLISPAMGWWLPKNVSTFGGDVDALFYFILAITGFFFILTEALLVYFMFVYAGEPGRRPAVFGHHYAEKKVFWTSFFKRIARPVTVLIHDQHRLELVWSIVPGVILLIIAIVQIRTWEEIKYYSRMPQPNQQTQQIEVSARQFEWRVRYPSPERMAEWETNPKLAEDFLRNPHQDDLWVVNEVHAWKDNRVLVHLNTRDVIHSFYLPNLRLKQDALPGKTIPVWFQANEANTAKVGSRWVDGCRIDAAGAVGTMDDHEQVWELACAELCGWGHYKMVGRLYVHKDKADFMAWLQHARAEQNRSTPPEKPTITAAR